MTSPCLARKSLIVVQSAETTAEKEEDEEDEEDEEEDDVEEEDEEGGAPCSSSRTNFAKRPCHGMRSSRRLCFAQKSSLAESLRNLSRMFLYLALA